jgi:histidinol-phosphatase (PHP family)
VIVDYHMHLRDGSEAIAHRVDAIEEFVEAARRAGVDEIGFAEHVYYFRETRTLWTVPYQIERCTYPFEPYVEAVVEAKRRGLPVKLGLEVDYVRGREDETRDVLAPYPWDYLLGSVHFIDGLGVDGAPRLVDEVGVEEAWRLYFEHLRAAAESGLFDALSHPDLVKISGDVVADWDWDEVAASFAAGDVAAEISTAGLHRPVGELYPAPDLLGACRRADVPVTLASDAHTPGLVGRDFDQALAHARDAGYETVSVFDARRRTQALLP